MVSSTPAVCILTTQGVYWFTTCCIVMLLMQNVFLHVWYFVLTEWGCHSYFIFEACVRVGSWHSEYLALMRQHPVCESDHLHFRQWANTQVSLEKHWHLYPVHLHLWHPVMVEIDSGLGVLLVLQLFTLWNAFLHNSAGFIVQNRYYMSHCQY